MNSNLKSILSHYRLFTPVLKQYGKVTKVYTGNGIYALKETPLTEHHLRSFQENSNPIYKNIPFILTTAGKPYYTVNNRIYYLTPWMSERRMQPIDKVKTMLEEVATIHKKTNEKAPFHEQWKRNYREGFERANVFSQATLERYIVVAEKQTYMSPFHYLFCSKFPMWMATINQVKAYIQRWNELVQQEKELRLVVNHGKLSKDHFLSTTSGNFFLNVENVHWNVPQFDLINLWDNDKLQAFQGEIYSVYDRIFPLSQSEKYNFILHLLSMHSIIDVIRRYEQNMYESELQAVRKLQKAQLTFETRMQFANELLIEKEKQSHV